MEVVAVQAVNKRAYVLKPSAIVQARRIHLHIAHSCKNTPGTGREPARIGARCGMEKMRGVVSPQTVSFVKSGRFVASGLRDHQHLLAAVLLTI